MTRPRLLDLFCGVGGCSVGYARAGFDVTGVDLVRRPDYPYRLEVRDALAYLADHGAGFDVIAASPPCKRFTTMRVIARYRQTTPPLFEVHADYLTPTLAALEALGRPWIVENVPTAPLPAGGVILCGSMFGLKVRRHRRFVTGGGLELPPPPPCDHAGQGQSVGVYGHGGAWTYRDRDGGRHGTKVTGPAAAAALGIDWSDQQAGLSQAIPPAYTEWIGGHVLEHLGR